MIYTDNGGRPRQLRCRSAAGDSRCGCAGRLGQLPAREPGAASGGEVLARLLVRRLRILKVTYDNVAGSGRYVDASYSATGNPPANFGGGTAASLAFRSTPTLTGSGGGGGGR